MRAKGRTCVCVCVRVRACKVFISGDGEERKQRCMVNVRNWRRGEVSASAAGIVGVGPEGG